MTKEKFVVRLMDKDGSLLGWAEVLAEPRPQRSGASCPLWPVTPTQFLIEKDGTATEITIHWCDLDVARRNNLLESVDVKAGQVFNFSWIEPIFLVPGQRGVPLPGVTLHTSTVLVPPTGTLFAVAGV